jgi:hypothetical protein
MAAVRAADDLCADVDEGIEGKPLRANATVALVTGLDAALAALPVRPGLPPQRE